MLSVAFISAISSTDLIINVGSMAKTLESMKSMG